MTPSEQELTPEERKAMAGEFAGQLATIAPAPAQSLTLFQIEGELIDLLDLLEDPETTPESAAVIEAELNKYFAAEREKVDRTCAVIKGFKSFHEQAKAEADRLYALAKHWESKYERVKDRVKVVMQAHGIKNLATPTNKLRVQGNGGLAPLELPEDVKARYRKITVQMNAWDFDLLLNVWEHHQSMHIPEHRIILDEPDNAKIRANLEAAGAKLGERGTQLRVE